MYLPTTLDKQDERERERDATFTLHVEPKFKLNLGLMRHNVN